MKTHTFDCFKRSQRCPPLWLLYLLTGGCLLFHANIAAQGLVRWQGIFTIVGTCPNDPAPTPGAYYFALLMAPAGTSDPTAFVFTGLYATNTSGGRVSSGSVPVAGWPAGTSRSFMVYGWSATAGAQWNPNWILHPPPVAFGHSGIQTGIAGGIDGSGTPWPTLTIDVSSLYLWPYIQISPADQTAASGSSVTFQTIGTPACGSFSYQWFLGTNALPNAASLTLTLTNVQSWDSGTYRVRVSNFIYGEKYSDPATLTVTPTQPTIIASPTNQLVPDGGSAAFRVAATGSLPMTYEWYQNGLPIAGATKQELLVPHVATWLNGAAYYVLVKNWLGTTQSAVATLTVMSAPPVIEQQPQSQTAEAGAPVQLQALAWQSGLNYQWWLNGQKLAAETNEALIINSIQSSQAGAYTLVVTNFLGAATSAVAQVSVIEPVPRRPVAGLSLNAAPGWLYLQFTPNPGGEPAWMILDSIYIAQNPQWYFDATSIPGGRYYRTFSTNTACILDLHMVPAITLSGPIGSSVHLDYINQFGPVDAWLPLATVTLTNSPQLYFDVSTIDQPSRLYRLVPIPSPRMIYEKPSPSNAELWRKKYPPQTR